MTNTPLSGEARLVKESTPIKIDISYAAITIGGTALWAIISSWLLYFYLPPDGAARVPVAFYGLAMAIVNVGAATLTPWIGYWSDNTHNRWGRRLPYMAISGFPMLLFFVLLWTPPMQGESIWNLVYLASAYLLYNITYAFYQVPYNALLPELARSDTHRVRIAAWCSSFMLVGMLLSSCAGLFIEKRGFVVTALIFAALSLPIFYIPLLVLRERPSKQPPPANQLKFWQSLSITLHNRAFLILTATGGLYWMTTTFVQVTIPYIVTEICLLSEADTLYFYIPAMLATMACYPLVTWLANRLGKWRVFVGSLLASALVLPGLTLIGPWLPVPLIIQGIVWITIEAVAMSAVIMLPPAFAAEITDYDEQLTGQRREGAYYATWGLLDQVVNGIALMVLPLILLLGRSRLDPHGPLGVRMVGIIGGIFMGVGFVIFLSYPLRHRTPRSPSYEPSRKA